MTQDNYGREGTVFESMRNKWLEGRGKKWESMVKNSKEWTSAFSLLVEN